MCSLTKIVTSLTQQSGEANESDDDTGDPLPAVTYIPASVLGIPENSVCSYQSEEHYRLLNKLETEIQKCGTDTCVQSFNH